jgi:hypothetical protein
MTTLPERINAMKVISYDVQKIVNDIAEQSEIPLEDVTLEMVMEWVEELVHEDFTYLDNANDVIYQDQNGEEIDA